MIVFEFVSAHVPVHPRATTSRFTQFLTMLMKLRLSLSNEDLACRSNISPSAVSKIFKRWISISYSRLKPLIIWPERGELFETMPTAFRKHFGKCVCIIDCFEVYCERPANLMARAQTYSQYKSHNTAKFLIGIAPQGSISFISQAYGGRASDKFITQNCGILDKLQNGDEIMADRGFTVAEAVDLHCARLVIPPFTRGKKQIERVQIDRSRQLSHVRIHVERVIGMLRQKYTFLQGTLPINILMHSVDGEERCILLILYCHDGPWPIRHNE